MSRPAESNRSLWYGQDKAGAPTVRLYFFWSATCPHCRRAIPFVETLITDLEWIEVNSMLLTDQPENVAFFLQVAERVGVPAEGVPTFAFCGRMEVGFGSAETTGLHLRRLLTECRQRLLSNVDPPSEGPALTPVEVPFLGPIDPAALSLPVFTILIAGLDAFNPCAFFVLLFLLSLLVHTRSRLRMAVIGGIFVFASGLIYFVFMAAWLNVFQLAGELRWVTTAAAIVAVALAGLNIKEYFWFKRGVSLSIPESARPGLFARMRSLTLAESWPALLVGTVMLAAAANTYELLCTAGFPMVFTRVLTLEELSSPTYYLYLVLYNVVYVIPLLGITTVFLVTLGSRKLQESEGRTLKLLSGLMMLGLGTVLLVEPSWLSDLRIAGGLLFGAAALTALIAASTGSLRRS